MHLEKKLIINIITVSKNIYGLNVNEWRKMMNHF